MQSRFFLRIFASLIFLVVAGTTQAEGKGELHLLEILRDKGIVNQQEFETLQQEIKASAEAEKNDPKIDLKGKFKITSADKNFSVQLFGRLDHQVGAVFGNSRETGQGSGDTIRRARIGVSGTLYRDWNYKLEYNLLSSSNVTDAYIRYNGKAWNVVLGNHRIPYGFENMSSSLHVAYAERSIPSTAFSRGRAPGITFNTYFANYFSLQAGAFLQGLGYDVNEAAGSNERGESFTVAGRLGFSPIHEKGKWVHIGVSGNYLDLSSHDEDTRFRSGLGRGFGNKLFDTGNLDGKNRVSLGVELAAAKGPVSLQAEFFHAQVKRDGSTQSVDRSFSGYYAQASWYVTGEARRYSWERASVSRAKVKSVFNPTQGKWGALEFGIRYSNIDLNAGDVFGGKGNNISFVSAWYPNDNLMFSLSYTRSLSLDFDTQDARNDAKTSYLLLRSLIFW